MKIRRLTKEAGEAIAAGLSERIDLEGTYWLVPRHDDPSRFFISPAVDGMGYRACVGRDQYRGRITVLINENSAVIMLGATAAPL